MIETIWQFNFTPDALNTYELSTIYIHKSTDYNNTFTLVQLSANFSFNIITDNVFCSTSLLNYTPFRNVNESSGFEYEGRLICKQFVIMSLS